MWKLNQSINKSKHRYTKGVNSVKIKSIYTYIKTSLYNGGNSVNTTPK